MCSSGRVSDRCVIVMFRLIMVVFSVMLVLLKVGFLGMIVMLVVVSYCGVLLVMWLSSCLVG